MLPITANTRALDTLARSWVGLFRFLCIEDGVPVIASMHGLSPSGYQVFTNSSIAQ